MKLREKLCILLSAAVLMQLLAGCGAGTGETPPPDETADSSPTVSQQQKDDKPTASPESSGEPSAEPTEEPGKWDPEHRLDIRFTRSQGLELPVMGATGYASIQLPLWGELPQGAQGKLSTIYAPAADAPAVSAAAETTAAPAAPAEAGTTAAAQEISGWSALLSNDGAPEEPEPVESTGESPAAPGVTENPDPSAAPAEEPTAEPTPEPTPESTPEPTPEPTPTPDPMADAALVLEPGTAFVILGESGDWWRVRTKGVTGWIEHRYCLINLPDVIPSMIYNDTNAYASVFVSCGKNIPGITGQALYQAKADNPRLGRREFMMPVLYTMAKDVCQAQQNALAEGNTLVLYEGFRPYSAQKAVVRGLTALSQQDAEVKAGISTRPWEISWFIATGSSNHQAGYAMDVSLAKVTEAHVGKIGGYSFVQVDGYEEYTMPTPIHELSMAAATFTKPVNSLSATAWQSAAMAPAMAANEPAKALQRYCTSAGLTPLASEWWHFNDLTAYGQIRAHRSTGNYLIGTCLSTAP